MISKQNVTILTLYSILQFNKAAKKDAIEWLLEKIEAKQKYGGGELFVRCEPQKEGQVSIF